MSEDDSGAGRAIGFVLLVALGGLSLCVKLERVKRRATGQQGQVVESADEKQMREEHNRVVTIHNNAVEHMRAGRYREAIEGFSKALALRPMSSECLVHRGAAYMALRMWKEALADFEKAAPSQAANVDELASHKGDCLFFLGRVKEAEKTYTEALKLSPDNLRLLLDRAQVRGHLEDLQGALEDYDAIFDKYDAIFEKEVAFFGEARLIAEAYYSRGCLLVSQGEFAEGRADIDRASKMGFRHDSQ